MTEDERRYLLALKRRRAALKARDDLVAFARFMRPDPDKFEDADLSSYQVAPHHQVIATAMERVERGDLSRLIIDLAPRHGKSELVSRMFPAWFLGRHPTDSIIFATYNQDLANDFGRDVRTILNDPLYQQVFPDVRLQVGAAAVDRLELETGGKMFFAGVGSAITGRGATCFPAGTMVYTDKGETPIEDLERSSTSSYVLSYDESDKNLKWRRTQAFRKSEATRLRRVTTASGRVVTATPEHPFYVDGRWVQAGALAAGDRLLRAVRKRDPERGFRDQQARKAWLDPVLLLRAVLRDAQERVALWRADLRGLWGARAEIYRAWIAEIHLLLRDLPRYCAGATARENRCGSSEVHVLGVQRALHAFRRGCEWEGEGAGPAFLLSKMRGSRALSENVRRGQSQVEERGLSASHSTALRQGVPTNAPEDIGAGWARLRRLLGVRRSSGGPPHRQLADEQRGVKSRDPMLFLSSEMACRDGWETVEDVVALVEDLHEEAIVYDIQVEGTHNFFANGILVHNCLIGDDFVKGRVEADSLVQRERIWKWFNEVFKTRLLSHKGRIVLINTRWTEDDVIGRLTDRLNPSYSASEAKKWKQISLPALAKEDDVLGRKPGEALWPEKFPAEYLLSLRDADPRGFQALYMSSPTPEKGNFFDGDRLRTYARPTDRPPNDQLRFYCASDHAVSTKQDRDKTCLMPVGVDADDNIWLLDDMVWGRYATDVVIEKMIDLMAKYKPQMWWAERGHISKSIGPFLRKRMIERGVYTTLNEIVPVQDKQTRAQSIRGRMSMGKVYVPAYAPWFMEFKDQLLKFPFGANDDAVDAFAYIGLGLALQHGAHKPAPVKKGPAEYTMGWIKDQTRRQENERRARNGGW